MENFSNIPFYIVVHDKAVRESIRDLLESYAAEVHTYSSGRSFLMNTHSVKPGYILLDDEVGDVSSIDMFNRIKQRNLPTQLILVLNSNYNNDAQESLVQSGFDAILHKPVNGLKLLQTIASLKPKAKISF
jgi:CheY-like chemotaxis protein